MIGVEGGKKVARGFFGPRPTLVNICTFYLLVWLSKWTCNLEKPPLPVYKDNLNADLCHAPLCRRELSRVLFPVMFISSLPGQFQVTTPEELDTRVVRLFVNLLSYSYMPWMSQEYWINTSNHAFLGEKSSEWTPDILTSHPLVKSSKSVCKRNCICYILWTW